MIALKCIGDRSSDEILSDNARLVTVAMRRALGVSGDCEGAPMPAGDAPYFDCVSIALCTRHRAQRDGAQPNYFPPEIRASSRSS